MGQCNSAEKSFMFSFFNIEATSASDPLETYKQSKRPPREARAMEVRRYTDFQNPTPSQEEVLHVAMAYKQRRSGYRDFALIWDNFDYKSYAKKFVAKPEQVTAVIVAALEKHFIFASLSASERRDFARQMELRTMRAGDVIIDEGTPADYMYIMQSGAVDFTMEGRRVSQTSLPGTIFGEFALLYSAPRAASVVCTKTGTLCRLGREAFRYSLAKQRRRVFHETRELLSKVQLFASLSAEQRQLVAEVTELMTFSAGGTIIQEGDEGKVFYVVKSGKVSCRAKGREVVLGRGQYFGERALLSGELRSATVTAVESTTVVAIGREDFFQVLGLGSLKDVICASLLESALDASELFRCLTPLQRSRLVRRFESVDITADETIYKQGDLAKSLYVLVAGAAQQTRFDADVATEEIVAQIGVGDVFGAAALAEGTSVRDSTVTALTDCECFMLRKKNFDAVCGIKKDSKYYKTDDRDRCPNVTWKTKAAECANVSLQSLQRLDALGGGSFGEVDLVRARVGKKRVYALKAIAKKQLEKKDQGRSALQEKEIHQACDHPFIAACLKTFADATHVYFLLEFVPGGELFHVIHKDRGEAEHGSYGVLDGIPEHNARFYGLGVLLAIAYLHDNDVVYRDLKPENVMIDRFGYPKLVDMGFAKRVPEDLTFTLCGTPEYIAPEVILGNGYGKPVDWWALGVLLYEMIAGYSPFSDRQGDDQMRIMKSIVRGFPTYSARFSSNSSDLVERLLTKNPAKRLGTTRRKMHDIVSHDFFEVIDPDDYLQKSIPAPWEPPLADEADTSNFVPSEPPKMSICEIQVDWLDDFLK